MIVQRSQALVASLDRRDALKADVERIETFQSRRTQLEAALDRVRPLSDACVLLRAAGVDVPGAADRIGAVSLQVASLQTSFVNDRDEFRRSDFRRFKAIIEDACAALERAVMAAWRGHIQKRSVGANEEILSVLGGVPAFEGAVREIRRLRQRLAELGNRIPATTEDLRALDRVVDAATEAWAKLDERSFSREVLEFLRKASSSAGAPLDALTPAVLQWAQDYKVTRSFRVIVTDVEDES